MLTVRELDAGLVVVGGGLAGVCAAIAAARHGAQTILVQDRPVLGGNSSSEIRVHVTGAMNNHPGFREGGIIEELRLEEVVRNPQRNPCIWDLILWEKVTAEPNVTLLLNTTVTAVEKQGEQIAAVRAVRLTTEDEFLLRGRLFMDCTGNGTLGALAGADFRVGREGPEEHNEPHAQGPDRRTMGDSIMWFAEDMGRPMPFTPPPWARVFETEEDLPHRGHGELRWGHWWIEYGGELDTIKDAEAIRDELLACMLGVWDHIKNRGDHGAENWALTWWNFLPGKRESRRLLGPYVLTENDLMENKQFEDAVAHGGWPIDTHPPGGIYSPEPPATFLVSPEVYGIPLRSLYSRNVPNLFMAGRNLSATHMALGSTRVMATCAVMGQAAGTAAALCLDAGCLPGGLSSAQVRTLQQALLKDDQYVPGVAAEDPADLAPRAALAASSEAEGCPAVAVVDGWSRALGEVSHQWRSVGDLPQWLELSWREPVAVREVHLTFDTGFQRSLCLTHSDAFNAHMIRAAQPETVRDYDLLAQVGGEWQTVALERGNYQRKRVHSCALVGVVALRLVVHATQGDPTARVFEVRVY